MAHESLLLGSVSAEHALDDGGSNGVGVAIELGAGRVRLTAHARCRCW